MPGRNGMINAAISPQLRVVSAQTPRRRSTRLAGASTRRKCRMLEGRQSAGCSIGNGSRGPSFETHSFGMLLRMRF